MSKLIVREFLGNQIRQREDGFLSLTDMCQANGKNFADWFRLKSTTEYLEVLRGRHYGNSHNDPIEVNVGGSSETTGTWGDRRVALRLAQWISAEFALQVDEWVEELLTRGTVSIVPSQRQLAPQRDLVDYINAFKSIGIDQDPILLPLITQRAAEEMGAKGKPMSRQILVAVRAGELGIPQAEIGTGSQLGKYIVACGFAPNGKTPHGRYQVNTFEPSDALDEAILRFFGQTSANLLEG